MNPTLLFAELAAAEPVLPPVVPTPPAPRPAPAPAPPPRLCVPERDQLRLLPCNLEHLLPADHLARTVWAVVEGWDLSRFYDRLRARGSDPGRAAIDPRLLIALWLYAATQNVASGRELARLCECQDAYRWLCGGVAVSYHTLNDFRVLDVEALDDLLTQLLATLTRADVVRLERITQDGTRVRASAGGSSFHRRATLEKHLEQARAHLQTLRQLGADAAGSARQQAARQAAASARVARLGQALQELTQLEQTKAAQKDKPSKQQPARASATDPEARRMRLGDGGTRPAYNVQFAADPHSRAIVGVAVSNVGSDAGLATPMRQQVEQRTEQRVRQQLLDGGYCQLATVDEAPATLEIYMPVPPPRKEGVDPHAPKRGDTPKVIAWRQRMKTAAAQTLYKQRAATSETVNGEVKTYRGLGRLVVRGLTKVRCQALWAALAYNVVHLGVHLTGS